MRTNETTTTTQYNFSMRCLATIAWHGSSRLIFLFSFLLPMIQGRRRVGLYSAGRGKRKIITITAQASLYQCVSYPVFTWCIIYKNSRRVNAFSTFRPPPQSFFLYSRVYFNRVAFHQYACTSKSPFSCFSIR